MTRTGCARAVISRRRCSISPDQRGPRLACASTATSTATSAAAAWFAASEAVTNALKHAGPARIWLSAVTEAACLRVRVTDDGVGGADPGGRGLRGLSERLAEHGGRLQVLGEERGGTTVVAEIPADAGQRAAVRSGRWRRRAESPLDEARLARAWPGHARASEAGDSGPCRCSPSQDRQDPVWNVSAT